jgi:hypothetical protein
MRPAFSRLAFVAAVLVLGGLSAAQAQDLRRTPGDSDLAFATRELKLSDESDAHVTAANWNGVPTLFVDYRTDGDDAERPIVALQQEPAGSYREIQVTVGEQEGGVPDLLAVGFARAEQNPVQDLIVILAWSQTHATVSGTLYEVRIFAPPAPGQTALTLLPISKKFGMECDCTWDDGTSKHFRFKTIASIKTELKRLGY